MNYLLDTDICIFWLKSHPVVKARLLEVGWGQVAICAITKYQTTKSINQMRETQGVRFWQRNYWEHVIRNETNLNRIRQYVGTNPVHWADDQLHPNAPPNRFNRG